MQMGHPLLLKQRPGKLLYLKPWYGAVWFQRKSSFPTDRCLFCATAASIYVIFKCLISSTEAALLESTFRYSLQLLCQPSCLCASKFNLFLFQPKKVHYYNKMKGAIMLLRDLWRKCMSQHSSSLRFASLLFSSLLSDYVHTKPIFLK